MSGLHHNRPPLTEAAVADVGEALIEFGERKGEFLRAAGNVIVRDRASAGDAADVVKLANDVWKLIETKRLAITNPYRDAADAGAAAAHRFWADVHTAMQGVREKIEKWDGEERQRVADQRREQEDEERRLRSEQAAALPSPPAMRDIREADVAPIATAAPIVGDYGGRVARTPQKTFTVENVREIPIEILSSPKVTKAIVEVARDFSKHMPAISGIRIETAERTRVN